MQDKNFLIFVAEYTYCRKVTNTYICIPWKTSKKYFTKISGKAPYLQAGVSSHFFHDQASEYYLDRPDKM